MPRVNTQKANKDYPEQGIKKGDTYYSWAFRYGGKYKSKTPPKASQLTQSKMSGAYAAGEELSDAIDAATTPQDIADALNQCAEDVRSVAEEYRESADNIREKFSESPTIDDCEEKADTLEGWADSLEGDASEVESLSASDYIDEDTFPGAAPDQSEEDVAAQKAKEKPGERDVSDFDELTDDEKESMMDAAREIANQNADCPA